MITTTPPYPNMEKHTRARMELVETKENATKVAGTLVRSGTVRLEQPVVEEILKGLAEGCDTTKLLNRVRRKHGVEVSSATIEKYRKEYAPKINEMAEEWDSIVIRSGLARKAVRIGKLGKLVEAIELSLGVDKEAEIESKDAKLIAEYRSLLRQIAEEIGDMDTTVGTSLSHLSDDDLLRLLKGLAERNPQIAIVLSQVVGTRPSREMASDFEDGEIVGRDDNSDSITRIGDSTQTRSDQVL